MNYSKVMSKIKANCILVENNSWLNYTKQTGDKGSSDTFTLKDKGIYFIVRGKGTIAINIYFNGIKIVNKKYIGDNLNVGFRLCLCKTATDTSYEDNYIIAESKEDFSNMLPLEFELEISSYEALRVESGSNRYSSDGTYENNIIKTAVTWGNVTIEPSIYYEEEV